MGRNGVGETLECIDREQCGDGDEYPKDYTQNEGAESDAFESFFREGGADEE